MIKKEADKILKYKALITEIQRRWSVKAKVIPVITGAAGTTSKATYRKSMKLRNYKKQPYWTLYTYYRKC